MVSPYLIGLGAGFVSAVLFMSSASGNILSLILVYLTPLPGFLAGLGWGVSAVITASMAGTLLVMGAVSVSFGGTYALTLGMPAIVLCYLASLRRPSAPLPKATTSDPQQFQLTHQEVVEWYPAGRIIAWASLMAGGLAVLAVVQVGADLDSYRIAIETSLSKGFYPKLLETAKQSLEPADLKALSESLPQYTDLFVRYLPIGIALVWLLPTLLNMWLAMRIADVSGLLKRPIPKLTELSYPAFLLVAFLAAAVFAVPSLISFSAGFTGVLASGFFGSFLFVYMILGLAILHTIIPASALRPMILTAVYIAVLFFGWMVLTLALLAIVDPIFRLRERFAKPPPSPGSG